MATLGGPPVGGQGPSKLITNFCKSVSHIFLCTSWKTIYNIIKKYSIAQLTKHPTLRDISQGLHPSELQGVSAKT